MTDVAILGTLIFCIPTLVLIVLYFTKFNKKELAEKGVASTSQDAKGCLYIFFIVIMATIIGTIIKSVMARAGEQPYNQKYLQTIANKINEKVPMVVDPDTRLDKVTAPQESRLKYHYTLTNIKSTQYKPQDVLKSIKSSSLKNYCESEKLKGFRLNGVSLEYQYKFSDNINLGTFVNSPKECKH